jgi:hypothetical protein
MGEGQPPGAVELIKASYNGFFAERFDPAARSCSHFRDKMKVNP